MKIIMKIIQAIFLAVAICFAISCKPQPIAKNTANIPANVQSRAENQTGYFAKDFSTGQTFKKYLIYLPSEYGKTEKKFPVILQLHNAAYRGENLDKLKETGLLKAIEKDANSPFIVISPLCPAGKSWVDDKPNAVAILDEVLKNYNAEATKVYLIGHSIGGTGTWQIGADYSGKFAAIAPLANGGNLTNEQAAKLKDMPIWAFHGEKDDVVPLAEHQKTIDSIKNAGNLTVKFTVFPDKNHSLTGIYDDGEILKWFLSQSKK